MRNIERFMIKMCCGRTGVVLRIGQALSIDLKDKLVAQHLFVELSHFTRAGIFYIENSKMILTGTLGSDKLQVKTKSSYKEQDLIELEEILRAI